MTDYARALAAARTTAPTLPDFDRIVAATAEAGHAHARDRARRHARARQWQIVAALAWLLLPLEAVVIWVMIWVVNPDWATPITPWSMGAELGLMVALPASVAGVGARLTRSTSLRAAIGVRAIAASNLVVALLYAVSVGGVAGAVFSVLLAFASARTLALLGEDGLDGDGDPDAAAQFAPVRFRGILLGALILAAADVLTLGFSSAVECVHWIRAVGFGHASGVPTELVLTVAAALVMLANVWGLLRLRTWALLSNLVCNLAVAGLAVGGLLAANLFVGLGLAATAAAQLLLVVPILAAALGDEGAGVSHARLGAWARWLVPALVFATVIAAALNAGPAVADDWVSSDWPRRQVGL